MIALIDHYISDLLGAIVFFFFFFVLGLLETQLYFRHALLLRYYSIFRFLVLLFIVVYLDFLVMTGNK